MLHFNIYQIYNQIYDKRLLRLSFYRNIWWQITQLQYLFWNISLMKNYFYKVYRIKDT